VVRLNSFSDSAGLGVAQGFSLDEPERESRLKAYISHSEGQQAPEAGTGTGTGVATGASSSSLG
ncbi:unnamed protein product, partial [Chrysoparadoxa australica]